MISFFTVLVMSLVCEYISGVVGMGYGTVLVPLLIVVGFNPIIAIPAVLLGQIIGGITGGFVHYKIGNVELKKYSVDTKSIFILTLLGIFGVFLGAITAISIPNIVLNIYIGIMVIATGLVIFFSKKRRVFSWFKMVMVGIVSSFNKGISGGGYGPLVTGGQIISGRNIKNSIGVTTITEISICLVGFLFYILLSEGFFLSLAVSVGIGSAIAAPIAALTVKKIDGKKLKYLFSIVMIILGVLMLVNVV